MFKKISNYLFPDKEGNINYDTEPAVPVQHGSFHIALLQAKRISRLRPGDTAKFGHNKRVGVFVKFEGLGALFLVPIENNILAMQYAPLNALYVDNINLGDVPDDHNIS